MPLLCSKLARVGWTLTAGFVSFICVQSLENVLVCGNTHKQLPIIRNVHQHEPEMEEWIGGVKSLNCVMPCNSLGNSVTVHADNVVNG